MSALATQPRIFGPWLEQLLPGPVEPEIHATCDTCPMCPPPGQAPGPDHYLPTVKCCTFTPTLPNFLVGDALASEDPRWEEGRQRLRQRLKGDDGVTPMGVHPRALRELQYRHGMGAFGRAQHLACPWLDARQVTCTIWPWRGSTCGTWFCRHLDGARSQRLWRAVLALLKYVELSLSAWCVLELDLPRPAVALAVDMMARLVDPTAALAPWRLDDQPEPGAAARWGEWAQRREAFFLACAERTRALGWPEVRTIGGAALQAYERLVLETYAERHQPPPARLFCGALAVRPVPGQPDCVRLTGYSPYDPLEVPAVLVPLLTRFDGRPTAEVLAQVKDETGWEIDAPFLARLVDWGILVAHR